MFVENWPALAAALGDALYGLLGDAVVVGTAGAPIEALRLETDDVMVQALPWELALPPPWVDPVLRAGGRSAMYRTVPKAARQLDTAWIQRGLNSFGMDLPVDGVLGQMTLSGLEQFAPGSVTIPLDPVVRPRLEQSLDVPVGEAPTVVIIRPDAYTERWSPPTRTLVSTWRTSTPNTASGCGA